MQQGGLAELLRSFNVPEEKDADKEFIKDNKNKNDVPYWLEHSEVCKKEEMSLKDKEELESIMNKYK